MRKILWGAALAVSYSFVSVHVRGQTLHRPVTAAYSGQGAYSAHHADIFSAMANPAALVQVEHAAVALFAERKFLLNELNKYTAIGGFSTSSGHIGFCAAYSGFAGYNETGLGLIYARKLGTKIDIGARFDYNSIRISNYGNAAAISFQAGTVMHLTEKIHAGLYVDNPVGGKFGGNNREKIPSLYAAGIGYEASSQFFFGMQIEKEEDQPVNVNTGIEYKLISYLLARAGISSATSSAYIGCGFLLRSFRIDITTGYHPQLGISPGLLVLFNMNKRGEWKDDH